jgi:hypothetical protein
VVNIMYPFLPADQRWACAAAGVSEASIDELVPAPVILTIHAESVE